MDVLIIYGSETGNSKIVAEKISKALDQPNKVKNVIEYTPEMLKENQFDLIMNFILVCPTWGDAELQLDFENFLFNFTADLTNKNYAICELGNYYGYDDFEFGASRIIDHFMEKLHGTKIIENLSLDSFPRKDYETLTRWTNELNIRICQI